ANIAIRHEQSWIIAFNEGHVRVSLKAFQAHWLFEFADLNLKFGPQPCVDVRLLNEIDVASRASQTRTKVEHEPVIKFLKNSSLQCRPSPPEEKRVLGAARPISRVKAAVALKSAT